MNWEDFLRASSDYKQNRTIVKQYFHQLGPIPPTFRLLVWSEMIPIHHKDFGFGQEALLAQLQIKVRKQKVQEIYNYLYNTFKYQLNQVENEPHTEGDDQDVQLLKQKFMNICYYLVETFYGEAQVIKRFLMTELQHQDKYKQMLVEGFMSEMLEGFFFDLQGSQKTPFPSLIIQILDQFFLFGLEFICLLIKAIIQDFDMIFDRQCKEMEEQVKKQNKPISHVIQGQIEIVTAEIFHLQIEDPSIIPRSVQSIQQVILSQNAKKSNHTSSVQVPKQTPNTNSNSKQLKYSPSKANVSKSNSKNISRTIATRQDELETTGTFNTKSLVKNDASPSKAMNRGQSRRNSTQEYQTPSKLKVTPESKSPLQSQVNKSEDFNTDVLRLVGKYGSQRLETYFSKSRPKEIQTLRQQVLELQKRAIDMGKMCQDMLFNIEHLDKEN